MSNKSTTENIILYPRSYNKRGDESLHSVQGVTPEGEEVNIKLRVSSKYQGRDGTPSIAEFAREDYGAKNACIASPDNSPEKRQGILLFSGCEPDGENRKGITSYIARWAHRLVSDADAPAPVIGTGRVDIAEDTSRNRGLKTDIEALKKAKPTGWEGRIVRLEEELNDATRYAYSLRIYLHGQTRTFRSKDTKAWEQWIAETINQGELHGSLAGVFIRAKLDTGKFLPEIASELIPIWNPKEHRYQNGQEIASWFHRQNPEVQGLGDDVSLVIMPIQCHVAGQVFKKFYGEPERLDKLRQQFYPGGEPELSQVIASQSLHEGKHLLLRVHALSDPLGRPMKLNEHGDFHALIVGEEADLGELGQVKVAAGLNVLAPIGFPAWFEPIRVMLDESDISSIADWGQETGHEELPLEPGDQPSAAAYAGSEPEMLDELVIVDDITMVTESLEPLESLEGEMSPAHDQSPSSTDEARGAPTHNPVMVVVDDEPRLPEFSEDNSELSAAPAVDAPSDAIEHEGIVPIHQQDVRGGEAVTEVLDTTSLVSPIVEVEAKVTDQQPASQPAPESIVSTETEVEAAPEPEPVLDTQWDAEDELEPLPEMELTQGQEKEESAGETPTTAEVLPQVVDQPVVAEAASAPAVQSEKKAKGLAGFMAKRGLL
jgi:hypothetical protein